MVQDYPIYINIYQKLLSKATYSAFRLYSFSMCVPWELNPQPFAQLTQCSITEQQEHIKINVKSKVI